MRGPGKDVFVASSVPSEQELEECPVTFRPAITLLLCFGDQERPSDSVDPGEGGEPPDVGGGHTVALSSSARLVL